MKKCETLSNIVLIIVKWMLFMSNHTLVALVTAIFEKCGLKHGSEKHVRLMQQSKDLYQEFKVLLHYFFCYMIFISTYASNVTIVVKFFYI